MPEQDIYKDIIGEFFTEGLAVYLDKHRIDEQITAAIDAAVDRVAPRRMVLTPEEAAKVLGVSRGTFDKMVSDDEIPHYRRSSRVLVPVPALNLFLECPEWFDRHGLDRSGAVRRLAEFKRAG